MKENKRVLDEELSKNKYVTYDDVASILVKDKNDDVEYTKIKRRLSKCVSRDLKPAGVLDFKNKINGNDGFKYKCGNEHYLRFLDEKKEFEKKTGIEKVKYATIGLGLLLKEESTECNLIEFECVRNLNNAEHIVDMAHYIIWKNVLQFSYVKNNSDVCKVIFHPQYLREYNNRWAVYGKCENTDEYYPKYIKIDSINFSTLRIVSEDKGIKYQEAAPHFYKDYFKDMIGFKHYPDTAEYIYITTNTKKVHNLIKTKPFHESQGELETWSDETQHGKFVLHVIPNIELRTKLLSYGSGITLEGNGIFQREFKEEIKKMAELYKNNESDKQNK